MKKEEIDKEEVAEEFEIAESKICGDDKCTFTLDVVTVCTQGTCGDGEE